MSTSCNGHDINRSEGGQSAVKGPGSGLVASEATLPDYESQIPNLATSNPVIKYIKARKPADNPLLPHQKLRPATLVVRSVESSPFDLFEPSTMKGLLPPLTNMNDPNNIQTCQQCILLQSTLALNSKQLEDQELFHNVKIQREKEIHQDAEILWEAERIKLNADAATGRHQTILCQNLHIGIAEHRAIIALAEKELDDAYGRIAELQNLVGELEGQLICKGTRVDDVDPTRFGNGSKELNPETTALNQDSSTISPDNDVEMVEDLLLA
ncbi:uncharacterized protein LY89DRAFT_767049 [Mollisia scopiformis]|uniref:Uncharacterized protein n=1 Tax=Mollisia scopiformis TaxID=149040 RepID=A0A132B481_MOLSC|nr:uncharacterized protein LY89DRAFT_767049 [Mollisia scopiformis]KUJ07200.1 hypothetical protein LY89DRAFT_767049 [Mollisia scopiformis]